MDVGFIYEGFLVRLRNDLCSFLSIIMDLDFEIVIFTSANPLVYKGLLERCEEYIKEELGMEEEDKIWSHVLYREDCRLNYTEKEKPYHHKDLTLFGCHLSRLVIVDNSPIVCHGFEPNFLLIKDFFGKDDNDNELTESILPILEEISAIDGDIRYYLTDLDGDPELIDNSNNLNDQDVCWKLTKQFMTKLDEYYQSLDSPSPPMPSKLSNATTPTAGTANMLMDFTSFETGTIYSIPYIPKISQSNASTKASYI